MTNTYRLAERIICVTSLGDEVHWLCADYRTADAPLDFSVVTAQADIDHERERSALEDRKVGVSIRHFSDGYYRDIKDRLILNEGSACGYHLSDEDFYVYMLAHEYKHYFGSGTGLRSLLDTYVFLKQKSNAMNWPYIYGELDKLEISDFEAKNRSLALHLFDGETLTAPDQEMLDYILSSGTYGSMQNRVRNRIRKYGNGHWGKLRYILRRLFLPMKTVRISFPLFIKCPILLPFLPAYRIIRSLTVQRNKMKAELKALRTCTTGVKDEER